MYHSVTKKLSFLIFFAVVSCLNEPKKNHIEVIEDSNMKLLQNKVNKEDLSYLDYCNNRFSYCLEYPSNFVKAQESGNGDGQNFHSEDMNANISIWGEIVMNGISGIEINYNRDLNHYGLVKYKYLSDKSYIISGQYQDKIFYKKVVCKTINYFGEITEILVSFIIHYPESQKKKFDDYCVKVNKELN